MSNIAMVKSAVKEAELSPQKRAKLCEELMRIRDLVRT
jgi:hypothetical protein